MTPSPAKAESGPHLLSEKMWDLNKHMKGACEGGGPYLRNINKPTSANKKPCKKRIAYSGSKWSIASTAKWLFQSAVRDSDSKHFLYHLALELDFGFVL